MYSLPDEILELIVQQNEDSIRTLISWSLLSPYIRRLVSKEIGIITIQDGLQAPLENLLGYQCLIANGTATCNHLNINSDYIDDEYIMTEEQSFTYFISQFENLLLVIESTRPYCEKLANTLTRIANSCHSGVNICVFYKTHKNFLSKLYFKQFKLMLPNIFLTELYLFGNYNNNNDSQSAGFENNLIDIDTLFKTVHIEQIKTIYSLDIVDDTNEFNGGELTTIKKVNYHESVNLTHFLRKCTNIKNIDYLRFPILMNNLKDKYTFNIPQCEEITLCEYNNDVSHPIINGVKVTQKLSLKPTLRTSDPTFENLYFPHIKTLSFPIYDFRTINFKNCDFQNVRNLNVHGCMIPWHNFNSLIPHNDIEIKLNITLRLTDWQQLKWLKSCPFKIQNLEITGNEIQFLPKHFISNDPPLDQSLDFKGLNDGNKFENITLHMNSLDQINLLQEIISNENSCSPNSSLKIIINESKLKESIIMNKNYSFTQELVIPISKMNHLTILLLDDCASNHSFFHRERLLSNGSQDTCKNDISYFNNWKPPSIKWYDEVKTQVPTISPSKFRKNSIAGLPVNEARRQSIISFNSIGPNVMDTAFERRRSSLDSVSVFSNSYHVYSDENAIDDSLENGELVTLKLQGTVCPDILTVNLNSIDSSVVYFGDLPRGMKIPLLQIWFTPDTPFTTYEALVSNLTNKIINMIHYPYNQMIYQLSFHKLQLFVDITNIKEKFEAPMTFESIINDLSYALLRKGHSIDFIKNEPNDRELVERSPNFSICIDI